MKIRKLSYIVITVILTLNSAFICGCSNSETKINDSNGNLLANLESVNIKDINLDKQYKFAYLDVVVNEATEIISEIKNVEFDKAKELLKTEGYVIDTYFNEEIVKSIDSAYITSTVSNYPFGCAITDLNGHILGVYSSENSNGDNYANLQYSPYSSIKPLSVYAPAIESNIAYWSKVYEDSPYKQIKDEDGNLVDWPENATYTYANKNITVYQAVKESLNTVAVKCLSDLGVQNSLKFLTENFNVNLDYEINKSSNYGDEEVIGNLAMGYLYNGVTPVEMAGYYQIFANGGNYCMPVTISKITDASGKIIYKNTQVSKKVISEDTAYIVNKLLQGVVTPDGTGAEAYCENIEVGGKTGTGTANDCHWFVGFDPNYSCAVWHGGNEVTNYSPRLFREIITEIEVGDDIEFEENININSAVYCLESGKLSGENCRQIDFGYYSKKSSVDFCEKHK